MMVPLPRAIPGPVSGMGNSVLRYQPRPEDWGLELVLGAVGTEAYGAHSGKSLSNPTAKPHLPGHTSGNANEAIPSGGGSASEGPSPFGLLRCRESYRGHIKGSELHYKGLCGFVDL